MSVYRTNPDALPDSAFERGELHHLVVGNTGRLLDPRRTPVSIRAIHRESGTFVVRLEDFEDKGALWEIPFEDVTKYQFGQGAARADATVIAEYRQIAAALDRPLVISCDLDARAATVERLRREQAAAAHWLAVHSTFFATGGALPDPEGRRGDERLWRDLQQYMQDHQVGNIEERFARQYVGGPHSGEIVRGHRIVLAELGLVPYDGKVPRNPTVFDGMWTRERRAMHVLLRLGFVRAMFCRLGMSEVRLYRGMSICGPVNPPRNHTYVSASFSRRVAESHFNAGGPGATRVLLSQTVPIDRLFMTYYETAPMNANFLEAEAVLLWDDRSTVF